MHSHHGTYFVESIGIRESKQKGYLDITLPDRTDIEFPDIFEGLHTPIAIWPRATREGKLAEIWLQNNHHRVDVRPTIQLLRENKKLEYFFIDLITVSGHRPVIKPLIRERVGDLGDHAMRYILGGF